MTKREAAIVSAYTGYLVGDFGEMHAYVDSLPGFEGIMTIGLAMVMENGSLRDACRDDFVALEVTP